MSTLLIILGILLYVILILSAFVSAFEKEFSAFRKLFFLSFILPLPFIILGVFQFSYGTEAQLILLVLLALVVLAVIIPTGNRSKFAPSSPSQKIDERVTMFSRRELKPGTEKYEEYYQRFPEKQGIDDEWRKLPGLMNKGSSQFNPFHFASAHAGFETIDALKDQVDGQVASEKQIVNQKDITRYIKNWSKKLGALNCGITALKDYHMYSVGGRADRYGKAFSKKHQYAIAFTVEMDQVMTSAAPSGSIVMESAQQYLESGKIAVQMAMFIRNLGYEARAHIDGNYEVVCPLVARDAGLGEIGRMGLLMTPKLGPRVRIAVVTTNLPLDVDHVLNDNSVIHFCTICKKCAESCPGQAISYNDREDVDGVNRWQINQEACFELWCKLGTDCGRCISVCPYSHRDNLMHNLVRAGIKNSSVFRHVALKLDDFVYGRKPSPKAFPKWMKVSQKK